MNFLIAWMIWTNKHDKGDFEVDNNEELVEQQETTVETSMEEGQETVTEISEVEA